MIINDPDCMLFKAASASAVLLYHNSIMSLQALYVFLFVYDPQPTAVNPAMLLTPNHEPQTPWEIKLQRGEPFRGQLLMPSYQ